MDIHVRHIDGLGYRQTMMDFARARQGMIDGQLRAGGVFEAKLLARFGAVPRERFVPAARRELAYVDDIQWFGPAHADRFMPPAAPIGKLLQLAEIRNTDAVLDVGSATGYATAIAAGLAASVTGLEQDGELAARAADNLSALGLDNGEIVVGGVEQIAGLRFDVIFMQGMLDSVPSAFLALLADGGRLVCLLRTGSVGVATVFVSVAGTVTARQEFNASLPLLFGVGREVEFVF